MQYPAAPLSLAAERSLPRPLYVSLVTIPTTWAFTSHGNAGTFGPALGPPNPVGPRAGSTSASNLGFPHSWGTLCCYSASLGSSCGPPTHDMLTSSPSLGPQGGPWLWGSFLSACSATRKSSAGGDVMLAVPRVPEGPKCGPGGGSCFLIQPFTQAD